MAIQYKVKKGFMAFQFGKPTYCIGIECRALNSAGEYDCVIGKEEKKITVSLLKVNELIKKYGSDKIIRKTGGKNCYIIPVEEFEYVKN